MIHASTAGGPCMNESLTGFFNATVDIYRSTSVQNSVGEPVLTWAVVNELVELPAMVAGGDVSVRMKKQEVRTTQMVYEMEYRRVLLNGNYPSIHHEDRARFYGRDWAIVSVTQDVTGSFTELLCESLEPGVI